MARRAELLELAVLGLLVESPMHGYELRKRLNAVLGTFHAISYGSLYPCLRHLVDAGLIAESAPDEPAEPVRKAAAPRGARRGRIVYELTADGKDHLQELLADAGPHTWDDERFGVHFALFGRTDSEVRMRILQGRRSRLEERLASLRASLSRTGRRLDDYTLELQRHGLESVEHEVRWLSELIAVETSNQATGPPGPAGERTPAPATSDSSDNSPLQQSAPNTRKEA